MSAPQHTPGPWSEESPLDDDIWIVEQNKPVDEWRQIAVVPIKVSRDDPHYPRNVAYINAHLIAAAPDLLAAARIGLAALERDRQLSLESACVLDSDGNPDLATIVSEDEKWLAEIDAEIATVRAAIAKAEGSDA